MSREIAGGLDNRLAASDEFAALTELVTTGTPVAVSGVSGAGSALLVAGLAADGGTALVVTYNDERARRIADDLRALLSDDAESQAEAEVLVYPSIASALYDGVTPDRAAVADRLTVLERLNAGDRIIVVTSVQALMLQTIPVDLMRSARREIAVGEIIDRDDLARAFVELGYEHVDLIDDVGQFSVRGGIVDVSPPTMPAPVRIELFGDEVESIRLFSAQTQVSLSSVQRAGVGPAGEILLSEDAVARALPLIKRAFRRELDRLDEDDKKREADRLRERRDEDLELLANLRPAESLVHYLPYVYDRRATLGDYLPEECLVVVDEPVRIATHGEGFYADAEDSYRSGVKLGRHLRLPETACISFEQLAAVHLSVQPGLEGKRRVVYLGMLRRDVPWNEAARPASFSTPPVDSFGGKFDLLVDGIRDWQHGGEHLLICSGEPEKAAEALAGRGLKDISVANGQLTLEAGKVKVAALELSGGFKLPSASLVVMTGAEIYGWRKVRQPRESKYRRGFSLTSIQELDEGDLVVHITHGIGRYAGLSKQTIGDMERDYLVIEYSGEDRIYVPVTQLDRVQRYVGPQGGAISVDSLKGKRWETAKRKARASTRLLARELMKLYRERERAKGHAFAGESPWMSELEASFRFEETAGQWQAIKDIKRDMEQPRPADRLICGDVGFGKTEVAIRAAFKAVLDGKQVAVLCPTTVLAHQHLNSFRERLGKYPVEIRMLSRFRTAAEQRKTIQQLKAGTVDVVIGTHRLLGSDVGFHDLGLIIVDEEQRFGVEQKERLKQLRASVDVLTLTATPIPRTLNMALSGIRDISVINDPPAGRLPIRTFVREHDEDLIREAVLREVERGGQIYFVHNRVKSIRHVAARLQRLVPDVNIAVAHGQMDEDELEQVMMAFYREEFDVLVCTTIIENGLDVPNANTMIVDDADNLGLAQLYQLRGRVGRSNRQAYAYLMYRYPDRMTEEAEQRLQAIEEFSELGSGFKVALRDLEIRGAGDILGAEQSGHVSAVGLDLYAQMLADSVRALKGEAVSDEEEGHPSLELPLEAVIPADYVPGERQRISIYRRLSSLWEVEHVNALAEEVVDRYGPMPVPVQNLLEIGRLRIACREVGIVDVRAQRDRVRIRLSRQVALTRRERLILSELYRDTVKGKRRDDQPSLSRPTFDATEITFAYSAREPERVLQGLTETIQRLRDREQARGRDRQAVGETA
ncbi:MAG: transcription-repair coupling factor [candidate division WS1 bacterium]|jgi:transcription-repair coupling factor (superfamily II helicase)|nr:transcription-repair coupling factor [candidate division WS1 bacterium]